MSSQVNNWICDSPKNEISQLASKEDLTSLLECPYCLDIPLPPVYLCQTGHIICSTCRQSIDTCGLCTDKFTGTRSFFYENLFEKTTFVCKYASDGCKELLLGKLLKSHQAVCDFRPLPCIKYGCANSKAGKHVAFSKYVNHMKEVHGAKFNRARGGTVCNGFQNECETWNVSRWVHEAYQFGGHTFFVNCQVRKPEVGIWLWYLGNSTDARNFRVQITLGNGNDANGIASSWEGPVHSIRKSYEEVMDEGHCLSTTTHAIKALCKSGINQQRAHWDVKFHIKEISYFSTVLATGRVTLRFPRQVPDGSGTISARNNGTSAGDEFRAISSPDDIFPLNPNIGTRQASGAGVTYRTPPRHAHRGRGFYTPKQH